jgi:hypothetical protein
MLLSKKDQYPLRGIGEKIKKAIFKKLSFLLQSQPCQSLILLNPRKTIYAQAETIMGKSPDG